MFVVWVLVVLVVILVVMVVVLVMLVVLVVVVVVGFVDYVWCWGVIDVVREVVWLGWYVFYDGWWCVVYWGRFDVDGSWYDILWCVGYYYVCGW